MSAFDTTVNVVGTSIGVPTEEHLAAGAPPALEIAIKIGQQLPFSAGDGQPPVVAELGTIRFGLNQDTAVEFFEQGLEAAKKLPVKPKLDIATNLDGVEEAAKKISAITGTK